MAHLESASLRALAHPLRTRLVAALRLHGPSTATALAQRLGTNSGATSYHLRQLADAGLVEEDPERGTARDRWWRSSHEGTTLTATDFTDDPDDRAAADWLTRHYARQRHRWNEDWLDVAETWPTAWREASSQSDAWLELTAEQLAALNAELLEVIARHKSAADPTDPAAERVVVLLASFPQPEPRI